MKKHIIFLLLIALLIIPISVQAVTVKNSIFTATMSAGSSASFDMILSPDNGEDRIIFESIKASGDQCASWIKLNKTDMDFTKSTPVNAAISVPKDAENGLHKCSITYTTPANGMIQTAIAVPIAINVRDGIEPTATPEPKITTIQAKEPTASRTPYPIKTISKPTAQAPGEEPVPDVSFSLLIAVSLISTGLIGVFIGVKMWWKK